jgi:hypothetical protein
VEKAAKLVAEGPPIGTAREALGSFLPVESMTALLATLPAKPVPSTPSKPSGRPSPTPPMARPVSLGGSFDVPFSIGRAR